MAFLVEDIPLLLLRFFAPMLGIVLAACAFLLLVRCWGACGNRLRRGFAGQEHVPPAQWVALSVVMAVCTLFSGKNTNGVQNVGMGNLFLLNPLYLFIRYFRKIVIEATVPTPQFHLLMLADALIAFGVGAWMYKKYNTEFLYYV